MALKVGDKVQVLDTELCRKCIKVGDAGYVVDSPNRFTLVYFPEYKIYQYFYEYQLQPTDEVIRVGCHKPSIFKRVCIYLRGKIQ